VPCGVILLKAAPFEQIQILLVLENGNSEDESEDEGRGSISRGIPSDWL
jgi:hypothetical protein